MTSNIRKYRKIPGGVDAAEYDGTDKSEQIILNWVRKHGGEAFPARELGWRHDVGTYWHPDKGFVYLPQGARRPGSQIEPLREDELVVRTSLNTFALVFPGDFVIRSRSGFHPRSAESFHRSYVSTGSRRGTNHSAPPPAV